MLSDCKSDRTLPKAPCAYRRGPVRTDLQSARLNIGICNPAILFIALQMLIFNAVGLQIRQNITVIALCLSRKLPVLIPEAPCACSRSSPCLSRKLPVLVPEAPRAYFGSASCLSRKRLVLIVGSARGYFPRNVPKNGQGRGEYIHSQQDMKRIIAVWRKAPDGNKKETPRSREASGCFA